MFQITHVNKKHILSRHWIIYKITLPVRMILFNKKHLLLFLILCFTFGQEYSLRFDGNDDYVLIQDHSELDFTNDYTLEAWVFPESFEWLAGIISKYHTPASHGYVLRLTSQSPYTGISFDEVETAIGILYTGNWFHIAAVNQSGQRKLYVNGMEYPLSGNPINTSTNTDPLRIGSDYGDRYFHGKIDEIRLWNIPRTATDIISSMETTLTGNEDGLVAYYSFNEGMGDTLHDNSNNAHRGIIYGNPSWADGYNLSGLSGDLNFDDVRNIYDTVILVTIILNIETGTEIQINTADINQDNIIDIADLVLLIQMILDIDEQTRVSVQEAKYFIQDRSIVLKTYGEIAGLEIELSHPREIMDNTIPSSWAWRQSEKKIIAYSLDGTSLQPGTLFLLDDNVKINDFTVVDWQNNRKKVQAEYLPEEFFLTSFPNPFNPVNNIVFKLDSRSFIDISIFNTNGEKIYTILRETKNPGLHQIQWKPTNLSSGSYFLQISNGTNQQTKKVIFLK